MSPLLLFKMLLHQQLTLFHGWLGFRLLPRADRKRVLEMRKEARRHNKNGKTPVHPIVHSSFPCVPFKSFVKSGSRHLSFGELCVISDFIPPHATVIDVGAFEGEWSEAVLSIHPNTTIHLFEASPASAQKVATHFSQAGNPNIHINNILVGENSGTRKFYQYPSDPTLNTAFRRISAEKQIPIGNPQVIDAPQISLDQYCLSQDITHIHLLKIDAEGAEHSILKGSISLLQNATIDMIQFEYGGTYLDAGVSLWQQFSLLQSLDYELFKITDHGLLYIADYNTTLENFEKCDYLAIHRRLHTIMFNEKPQMPFFLDAPETSHIPRKGVIHIGAHYGEEVEKYLRAGVFPIILVEANPELAELLKIKFSPNPEVTVFHFAASEKSGTTSFHITNRDHQSSSILPLARHSELYPDIKVERTIDVPMLPIDLALERAGINAGKFNLLSIDIQGAELLALRGATGLLNGIDIICTEFNLEELYSGCAMLWELDAFLNDRGFTRIKLHSPYHRSWGDAIYLRSTTMKQYLHS